MHEKVLRLIDANINRSLEGLRVIEDTARFILDDRKLSAKLKNIRHRIKRFSGSIEGGRGLLEHRDIKRDVGRRSTISEGSRAGLFGIFKANIKRIEESVRVLEEYSKLFGRRTFSILKNVRYDMYHIEKELSPRLKKQQLMDFDLYVISDKPSVLRSAVKGGARAVQLRIKDKSRLEMLRTAKKVAGSLKGRSTFIVNDNAEIARVVDADGVHVGAGSIKRARRIVGYDKLIGSSAYNMKQAIAAEKYGADYVGVGPVFTTPIKPDHRPISLALLRKIAKKVKIPVVAIGGINASNIGRVINSGVKRAAVIRAVSEAKNIKTAVRGLISRMS